MELKEAKDQFVHTWGTLATQWGINRTMSQIHALLLMSTHSLNADEIMEELKISRGNVNMNLRDLMSWGLIIKQLHPGERKEYFMAEKDIWKVSKLIARERRRRELEPIIETLGDISKNLKPTTDENKEILKVVDDIQKVALFADNTFEKIIKSEESWVFTTLTKLLNSK